jgi:thioredoxin 1
MIQGANMKLVKISAAWCQPCKGLQMTLNDVDHPLVHSMEKVDIDTQIDRAMKFGVRSVPTMVIVDENDQVIRTMNGNQPKEKILEFLA